jgi:hypothetical protein
VQLYTLSGAQHPENRDEGGENGNPHLASCLVSSTSRISGSGGSMLQAHCRAGSSTVAAKSTSAEQQLAGFQHTEKVGPCSQEANRWEQTSGMRGGLDAGVGSVSGQMKTHKGPAPGEVAALEALRVPAQQVRQDVNAQCADASDQRHCCGVGSLKGICFRGSAMPRQEPAMKEYQRALCSQTAGCVPKKPAHHLATEPQHMSCKAHLM